ncbi:hypothetical protein J3Q64DRAFT_1822743 [Phycomyces blakesleeanus]|uniref:CCHC-type domain-containing protein n=1 Tax=Phycomyces blakesleeanus TaxID=4837 RepID=A0ABR3AVP0_PHYBL
MDAPIDVLRIEHNTISKELSRFRACHSESRCFYCREWAQFIYKKRYAWSTKLPEEPQSNPCQLLAAGRYNIAVQQSGQPSLAKKKTRSSTMFEKLRHLLDVATTETTPNGMSTSLTKELISICNTWLTMPSSLSSLPEIFEPITIHLLPENFDEIFEYDEDDDEDEDDFSLDSENSMPPEKLLEYLVVERQAILLPSESFPVLADLTADFLPIHQNLPCPHYRPEYRSPGDLDVEFEIFNEKMAQATSNALIELEQALDVSWRHLTEFMDRLTVLENERCELMGPQCQATIEAFAASQNLLPFQDYWATKNLSKRKDTVEQVDAAFINYLDNLKDCAHAFHTDFVIPRLEAVRQLVRQLWSMVVPTIQQMAERMASQELSNETHLQKCRAVADSLRELHPTVDAASAVEAVQEEMSERLEDYIQEIDALKKVYTEESRPVTSSRLDKINNKEFKKRIKKIENFYYSTRQHFRYQTTQKIFPESLFCKFGLVCIEALMQEGEMMEAVTIEREVKRFLESHDELVEQHDNLLYAFESSAQVGRRKFVGVLGSMFLQESIRIKGEYVALKRQNKLLKSMDLIVEEPETSKKKKKNKNKGSATSSPLPTPSISTIPEKNKPAQKDSGKATKVASSPKVTEKTGNTAKTAAPKAAVSPKVIKTSASTIYKTAATSKTAALPNLTDKSVPSPLKTVAATPAAAAAVTTASPSTTSSTSTTATASTKNSASKNIKKKQDAASSKAYTKEAIKSEAPKAKVETKPKLTPEQEAKEAQAAKEAKEAKETQEAKAKEAEARAKIKAEVKAAREAKMESLRQARAKVEAEARAKVEAELKAKEQAEEEARAKAKAKAQAAREAREKVEAERKAKEQAEQEAKAAADKAYREARDAKNKIKAEAEAEAKAKAEAASKISREEERLASKAREAAEAEARDAAAREASAAKLRAIAAKEEAEAQARIAIVREAAESKAKATAKAAAQQKAKSRSVKEASETKQKPVVNKAKSKEAAEAARARYEEAQEIEEAKAREETRLREEAKAQEDAEAAARALAEAAIKAQEEDAEMKEKAAWAAQLLAEEAEAAEARELAAAAIEASVTVAATSKLEPTDSTDSTASDGWNSLDLGGWGKSATEEVSNDGWEQVSSTKVSATEVPKHTNTWSQKASVKPVEPKVATLEDTWTQKPASPAVDSWNSTPASPVVESWNAKPASPVADSWKAKPASPVLDEWNSKHTSSVVDSWNETPASPAEGGWNTKSSSPVTDSWNNKPESPVVDAWKAKSPKASESSWNPKAAGSSGGGNESDNWRKPLTREPVKPEHKSGHAKPAWNKREANSRGWNQGWEENKEDNTGSRNALGGWGKDNAKEKSIEVPWDDKTPLTTISTFTSESSVNNTSQSTYSPLTETTSTKTTNIVAEIVSAPEPDVVHFSLKGLSTPKPPGLTMDIPIQQQEQQHLQSSFVGQRNNTILSTDNLWSMGHEGLISVIQTLQRDNAQLVQTLMTTQQEMAMMTGRYSELLALSRERETQTLQLFEARKQTEMEEARRYIHSLEAKIGTLETQLQTATSTTGGSTAGFGNQDLFAGYREEMRSNRTKRPWSKNVVVRCGNCGGAGHASTECNDVCRYCGNGDHLSESCTTVNH